MRTADIKIGEEYVAARTSMLRSRLTPASLFRVRVVSTGELREVWSPDHGRRLIADSVGVECVETGIPDVIPSRRILAPWDEAEVERVAGMYRERHANGRPIIPPLARVWDTLFRGYLRFERERTEAAA